MPFLGGFAWLRLMGAELFALALLCVLFLPLGAPAGSAMAPLLDA